MHYLPSLVALWLVPTGKLDLRWSRIGVEVLLAYGVFAVWLFQHNPYKVYQCRTQGPNAEAAKEAGADVVGMDDLAEAMKGGDMNYDVVIASPDAMRVVGALGPVLGPRGLMPNPKTGTVTPDVATAVKNAKSGQARYRTDKAGIIHCAIGSIKFDNAALTGNLTALMKDLRKAKPAQSKGVYFKKITLSTTMGPGLAVDAAGLSEAS